MSQTDSSNNNMPIMCDDCSILIQQPFKTQRQSIHHLHHFATNEPDEFLIFDYYICSSCHQIWQKSNSTYDQDHGWHWKTMTSASFMEQCGAQIEAPSPQMAADTITWALAQTRPFDLSPPFRL